MRVRPQTSVLFVWDHAIDLVNLVRNTYCLFTPPRPSTGTVYVPPKVTDCPGWVHESNDEDCVLSWHSNAISGTLP